LTTSGNYTDTTDSVTGVRTVTLSVNSDAQLQDCVGTSYTSTGNIHLSVSPDTVTITPDATYTNLQHWVLNRIESAYGTLDIQRHADGSMHHVTYSWNRNGTIAVTVDISGASLTLVSIDTLDQTVAVSANGQTCTGTLTGSLLQRYNWTCTAP